MNESCRNDASESLEGLLAKPLQVRQNKVCLSPADLCDLIFRIVSSCKYKLAGHKLFIKCSESLYSFPNEIAAVFSNSRADNSSCSGPIGPMIELIQILLDIKFLPKFGADWSIFPDDRV